MTLALFFSHWVEFNYTGEPGQPWYHAATWPNVFVLAITLTGGWLWSRTRFWPLNLIHAKLDEALVHHKHVAMLVEEIHLKMHTGDDHPRVKARRAAGEHPTPKL